MIANGACNVSAPVVKRIGIGVEVVQAFGTRQSHREKMRSSKHYVYQLALSRCDCQSRQLRPASPALPALIQPTGEFVALLHTLTPFVLCDSFPSRAYGRR